MRLILQRPRFFCVLLLCISPPHRLKLWPYHILSWPKAYLDSSEATRWQNYGASWVLATKVLDGWQICQRSQTLILCVWLFLALMGRRRWEAWFLGPEAGVPVGGGWRSASEGSGGLREADWAFVGEEEEGGSGQGGLHYWAAATSTTLSYQGTIPLSPQTKAQSHYPHEPRHHTNIPTKQGTFQLTPQNKAQSQLNPRIPTNQGTSPCHGVIRYDKVSDIVESKVRFASKNLTPCRMH